MDKQVAEAQSNFESIKHIQGGQEYWLARELMPLLGYESWQKFENAIQKAALSADKAGTKANNHFIGAAKLVLTGSGAKREIADYKLTRYACYLIAQNGDPRKPAIARAKPILPSKPASKKPASNAKKNSNASPPAKNYVKPSNAFRAWSWTVASIKKA